MEPGPAWPRFVGRADALQRLDATLAAAARARGSTVLVEGEAGIGKTRLVSELGGRAQRAGATVLRGRCIDLVGSGMSYLPLVEALWPLRGSAALMGCSLPELSRLVPELTEPRTTAASGGPDSRLRLFEETLTLLEHLGAQAPVVLVVEDLHWADRSTLDLVSFLAHAARERRLLLVATYRSDELVADSSLRRLVGELLRARAATALVLEPLERDEVAQLLAGTAEAPVPAELANEIYERSQGNPFFAEELLAAAVRGEQTLPRVLRDVLLQRLDGLDGESRALLRIAAAAGRDVPYRLLAAVAGMPEERLVEALRETVEYDVLRPDQTAGSYRFRHSLLAEAVYATLLPGEREELHERLARALRAEPGLAGGSTAAELAHHWSAAGRPVEALQASIEAALDAEAVSGPAEALRHFDRALELWEQVDDPESAAGHDLGAVLARAAEVAYFAGAGKRAPELLHQAISLADDDAELGLLYERLGTYLLPIGDRDGARAAFERAVELVPEQPPSPERARVLSALGNALSLSLRPVESRAACEQALAVAAAIGDDLPALRALAVLGLDLQLLGRGAEGVECLLDARRRAVERGAVVEELRTYVLLSDVHLIGGRLRAAAQDALEGVAKSRRYGYERSSGIVIASNAAEALLGLGDWTRAEEVLDAALHLTSSFRPEGVHLIRAELELRRGEFAVARQHLEAAGPAALEPQLTAAYSGLVAELALWERRPEDAASVVDAELRLESPGEVKIREPRLCALAIQAETDRAQLAAVRRDTAGVDDARRRAKHLLELARHSAADAAAVTLDAAGWLAIAEAEHSRVEGCSQPALWGAASAAWDQLERPYPAAYCRWRHAEALVAAGASRADAAVPARDAHLVASRLGARPLTKELELLAQRAHLDLTDQPALRDQDDALGLTAREREVLRLLARGYTNREIAAELTISIKTTSVHVSHILRKLDVPSRLEAARIAHQLAAGD
ncbi:AAA family ATPase [Kribbella sp. NPDC049227]|uniref:helix-turn-helix transcriptional regulator n=1 Tax=Kribbella sp. NPDC049227 TaxID=3364113 RepID=UPI003724BEE3